MGIPTVLLRQFGMTGNFADFPGLVDCSKDQVLKALDRQHEKCSDFIQKTLEGGLEFKSTERYIEHIARFI
jgi:hypothetical protein